MAYAYFVFREYDGAPGRVVAAFKLAAAAYSAAIVILALSEPAFCTLYVTVDDSSSSRASRDGFVDCGEPVPRRVVSTGATRTVERRFG